MPFRGGRSQAGIVQKASSPSAERPLSASELRRTLGKAVVSLVLLAALVLAGVAGVAFALLLEASLAVLLLRFGVGVWLLRWMEADLRLLWILIRSLGAGAKPGSQMTLTEKDAPGLHSAVRRICERMEAAPPDRIVLEMGVTAWIRLGGWVTGRGRSVLGVGHDLLAALSVEEVEAVLAHEFAHALRVNRGFQNALFGAARRCATLCVGLEGECARRRSENRPEALARLLLDASQSLCTWTHRLLATASRQDEFEADREAAVHFGSDRFASALRRLEAASSALGRVTVQERLARREGLQVWRITCVPAAPSPLAGSVWMSYATDGEAADGQMHELARLLHRSGPPPLPGSWRIEKAPHDQQPDGPCHPGLLPISIPHPR